MNYDSSSSPPSKSPDNRLKSIIDECDGEHQIIIDHIESGRRLMLGEGVHTRRTHGGSVPDRRTIFRDRKVATANLFNDYFSENPTYNEEQFLRCYRMSWNLFLRIVAAVKDHGLYFLQRMDAVGKVFGQQYLRSPTAADVARLLYIGQQRGFPGMMPGANNDINVLETSNLFSNLAKDIAPPAHYVICGKEYNIGYYLADGIYPKWTTLVQTIHEPIGPKKKYFATKQEACRKDVERAFGVLQSRFAIVANPSRFWSKNDLKDIMNACIIMHNMIIEDERDLNSPIVEGRDAPPPNVEFVEDDETQFQEFLIRFRQIKDANAHFALRNTLIEHLWNEYSNSEN
ncbi:Detected protein of unknown function [Hibiscus syriacus]|uniref:Uncharacterized protein n=1 Tax=Hibiscus syriacus TaxID=106335 RepID=A0A6A2Z8I1_HIBSY|nr:Detected protein of unknown function [Hibiscus syriacus]